MSVNVADSLFANRESLAESIAKQIVDRFGLERAKAFVAGALDALSIVDLAAHEQDWGGFWARPDQLPPEGDWITWSFLCGRGFGKTIALSKFVNAEIRAGRARFVCLMAQDESNSIKLQVLGPSGLIATADPDFKPVWEATAMELVYPNGARAIVRTPEVPGKIRGFEYHLAWLSEMQSWPLALMNEAFTNVQIATRLGYSRIVTDSTPKRRHALLRKLLQNAERDPERHVMIRGATHGNVYLGRRYIANLEEEIGGTSRGREELLGEFLDEADGALVKQVSIDNARRLRPERLSRQVIAIDPAVTSRAGNDRTGIIHAGLGSDGQAYILADKSERHEPAAWAKIVLEEYVKHGCDCVVVEVNKGGDLVTRNLSAYAKELDLEVIKLEKSATPRHNPRVVYVKEVHARGPKEDRAQPLATAYERGRVSHVIGADLSALEDLLTTWEPAPGQRSPDALDACVHAVSELLGLANNKLDASQGFKGIEKAGEALKNPAPSPRNLAALLGGGSGGRI
jgi:phage terminase large subunit-like protein